MAHSYFIVAETEEGIAHAYSFVASEYGMQPVANPDVMTLRHGLLSVDDARKLRSLAELSPSAGDQKVLIISASRLFHEAQNALLKVFEEPPAGTILILVLPAEGLLLPTLRSRLLELPKEKNSRKRLADAPPSAAHVFISASPSEREKMVTKLLDRTKSDKDDEKQAGRLAAIQLLEGLTTIAHERWLEEEKPARKRDLQLFLDDLATFQPILHERSAPLKLIFEHLLLVSPF